jgi:hypothetical protein
VLAHYLEVFSSCASGDGTPIGTNPSILYTTVIITIGPSSLSEFMVCLALAVNLRAEYCRAQHRGSPSVAEAFGALKSTDALRNPISVGKLQGPIVMITALTGCY